MLDISCIMTMGDKSSCKPSLFVNEIERISNYQSFIISQEVLHTFITHWQHQRLQQPHFIELEMFRLELDCCQCRNLVSVLEGYTHAWLRKASHIPSDFLYDFCIFWPNGIIFFGLNIYIVVKPICWNKINSTRYTSRQQPVAIWNKANEFLS